MSVRSNIIANYSSQIYTSLIGLIVMPLYLKIIGSEGLGLISFYMVLSACFTILDVGMTPAFAREVVRYRSAVINASRLISTLKVLEIIFVSISIFAGFSLFFNAEFMVDHWLQVDKNSLNSVTDTIYIISVIIPIRWLCGLYRSVINAFEYQVMLGYFSVIISTLRFIGVFVSLSLFGKDVTVFFLHQLVVAILELLAFFIWSKLVLPSRNLNSNFFYGFGYFKELIKFSSSIAFASLVWILLTQVDKGVLSSQLALSDYGYFSMAVSLAGILQLITAPISQAVTPRLTKLYAENNKDNAINLYSHATQLICVLVFPIAMLLILFSEKILWVWTGQSELGHQYSNIVSLYAIGNTFLAIGSISYPLLYAKGDFKLHTIGNIILCVFVVPLIILGGMKWGAIGTSMVWAIGLAFYVMYWLPYVHFKILPKYHLLWFKNDVLMIFFPVAFVSIFLEMLFPVFQHRLLDLFYVIFSGIILLFVALLSSSLARNVIINFLYKCFEK